MAKTANTKKNNAGGEGAAGKAARGTKAAARKRASEKASSRNKVVAKAQQKVQQKRGRAAKSGEKRSFRHFLREVRIELGKVAWPTRKELVQSVAVVLVAVAIATAYTGVLEVIFSRAISFVINVIT